jgi:hypothetical protein
MVDAIEDVWGHYLKDSEGTQTAKEKREIRTQNKCIKSCKHNIIFDDMDKHVTWRKFQERYENCKYERYGRCTRFVKINSLTTVARRLRKTLTRMGLSFKKYEDKRYWRSPEDTVAQTVPYLRITRKSTLRRKRLAVLVEIGSINITQSTNVSR